jgi:hypothetical protein
MPANETRENSIILRLAAMDFALAPLETVRQELRLTTKQIYLHRQKDLYRLSVKELQEAFKEKMLATPGTNELRKTINYGLSIAVKKLVDILAAKKTSNRDIVSAARLMAQMDGRFIGSETGDGVASPDIESVASELVTMIKRTRDTVQ